MITAKLENGVRMIGEEVTWGYALDNGEFLIDEEFNGETYHSTETGRYYRPVYVEESEGQYDIIGFEEEF